MEKKIPKSAVVGKGKNTFSVHKTHPAYCAYIKRKKISKYEKVDRLLYRKVLNAIFKEISKQIVYGKGGVLIRNFGYFFIWKTPRKMEWGAERNGGVPMYNYHSNHYKYKPQFIPAGGPNHVRFWSVDNRFNKGLCHELSKQIKSGFKYKSYVYTIRKLLNLS